MLKKRAPKFQVKQLQNTSPYEEAIRRSVGKKESKKKGTYRKKGKVTARDGVFTHKKGSGYKT